MRRPQRFCLVSLVFLTLVAGRAHAEMVTYAYTAVSDDDPTVTVSGQFSYLAGGPPSFYLGEHAAEHIAHGAFALEVDGQRTVVSRETTEHYVYEIWLTNGTPGVTAFGDALFLKVATDDGHGTTMMVSLRLQNSDGTAFGTHLTLPQVLDLDSFDLGRSFHVSRPGFLFDGQLDSLTLLPPGTNLGVIPEPGSIVLAGLGMVSLSVLGWVRRRRAG